MKQKKTTDSESFFFKKTDRKLPELSIYSKKHKKKLQQKEEYCRKVCYTIF